MSNSHELSQPPRDTALLPAAIEDVSDIRMLMQQASELKMSQGDDLWGNKPFTEEEVTGMLEGGNLFVYKVDGTNAATVLLPEEDVRMWGAGQGDDGKAIYVHKLCVGNDFRGKGVGRAVMDKVEELARQKSKSLVRLDCPYDNPGLCSYYESLGFGEVRRYDRPLSPGRRNPDKDMYRAALFEKTLD